jgi:PRTRC genetic system protein C
MSITTVTRKIVFEGKALKDIPGLSAQQLRTFYAQAYPELSTASVNEEVTTAGITITFEPSYKAQG